MDDETLEALCHVVCPFLEFNGDEECMKCSIAERGPKGGVRGCMHDGAKLVRAISAALHSRGLAVVKGWQPMETAPKDGTEILAKVGDVVTAATWCPPTPTVIGDCGGPCRCPEFGDPEEGDTGFWSYHQSGALWDGPDEPSAWMPLPAARPSLKEGE